jgi:hypothetical protein
MHRCGRLALIKTTLSTIPIYTSISLGLPKWMHKALIKIMRAFLWLGSGETQAGRCLVAWERVQWSLHLGGLGVLDLNGMGLALRMRWLRLSRVDSSCPWSGLRLVEEKATTQFFMSSIRCVLGNGSSTLFWTDP